MAKTNRKKGIIYVLIIFAIAILAFAGGYLLKISGAGDAAWQALKGRFGGESHSQEDEYNGEEDPGSEPGGSDEPGQPSDPGQEQPAADPPEQEDPQDEPGNDDPDPTPVIKVGQVLIIPVSGSGETAVSQVIYRGTVPSGKKQMALTFDSGWLFEDTLPLLDVLDRYGVTATFFPRGKWVDEHKELAKEIARRGHVMGNHSLTHSYFTKLSLEEVRYEMRESTRIIKEVTGVRPFMFRPPYGENYSQDILRLLAEEGYPYTIMWTIDTHDWAAEMNGQEVTADYLVNRVLDNATNGGIVLMHIGGAHTVEALPRIIEGLQQKGYTLTTVDKMLPPPPREGTTKHTVQKGETLWSISRKYGVTVEQIIEANNL